MLTKNLSFIFGSKTKAQEMVLLLQEAKEVVRQGFLEEELPKVEKFCWEQNLFLVKSKFKVLFADEKEVIYSNKGWRIPETDPRQGMFFIYISKDEEKALLASYYELMNDHTSLGLILGYPKCCVEFFCHNFNEKRTDLELPPKNMFTNLSQRKKDLVLLSHFPCNFKCPKSIALGKKYLDLLQKIDPERAQELKEGLNVKA